MQSGIRSFGPRRASTALAVAVPASAGAPAASEPLAAAGKPGGGGGWRSHLGSLAFLVPGAIFLVAIVGYPLIATIVRSFYDNSGTNYVGLGNFQNLVASTDFLIALRNNVIWVIVFPFIVTFLGLVFAVLTERIRWSTAFKTSSSCRSSSAPPPPR